jgi:hypothetical protein
MKLSFNVKLCSEDKIMKRREENLREETRREENRREDKR